MCSSGGSIQLPGVATRRSGAISIVASSSFATRAINRAWRPRRCRTSASPARPTSRADSRPGERPGFPSSGPGTLIEIAKGNPPRHRRPGSSARPTDDFDHQDRSPWLADPTRQGAGWAWRRARETERQLLLCSMRSCPATPATRLLRTTRSKRPAARDRDPSRRLHPWRTAATPLLPVRKRVWRTSRESRSHQTDWE
jgi:hypothetical protein